IVAPTSIQNYRDALRLETSIDFAAAEREKSEALQKISPRLDSNDSRELLAWSLAFRSGQTSLGDYHRFLKNLLVRKGVDLQKLPHLDAYLRYALLADRINADQLFSDLESYEKKIEQTWPNFNVTLGTARRLSLTDKLSRFALTPSEWQQYQELP